jgi:hypothetical protein
MTDNRNLSPDEENYLKKLEAAQAARASRVDEPHIGPTDEEVAAAKMAARSKRGTEVTRGE